MSDREILENRIESFLNTKRFTGVGGLKITNDIRITIAARAAFVVLKLDPSCLDPVREILVYPDDYTHPEDEDSIAGEVHEWGVMVLSWKSVQEGISYPRRGFDPVFHEIAHVLDVGQNGRPRVRGLPQAVRKHFERLRDAKAPERDIIDEYGAENEGEFFAVATEVFFQTPRRLKKQLPNLYRLMVQFYGQDRS